MQRYIAEACGGKGSLAWMPGCNRSCCGTPQMPSPFTAKDCAGVAGDKITVCNKPPKFLPRDKRWEAKCFRCSQIAVLGWGEKKKKTMKLVFGKVVSEPCKIVLGIEKLSSMETNKYRFL